ncbi:MAG: hypothetical protein P4L85_26420 [Paludisphaera borealis]|uniref:porin n=1 Tax=Paludisphaera borealis TaxID=1387353 RepID=UPI00283FCEBC|nr:hypothetical protein [Paludisphaera borealis]MDR3622917.1 hypothetical protein [Paludisphaera borealis]
MLAALIVPVLLASRAWADQPPGPDAGKPATAATSTAGASGSPSDLEDRLRKLEGLGAAVLEQNRVLTEQNRRLAEQNQGLTRQLQDVNRRHDELERRLDGVTSTAAESIPQVVPLPDAANPTPALDALYQDDASPPQVDAFQAPRSTESKFLVGGYDKEKGQFELVKPRSSEDMPFALNFDLVTQLRYTGFARSARTWTNSAGTVLPVRNFDEFAVNRNWFQFSGYALDPRLQFMAVVFSSSTTNSSVFLGWIDYRFSKAFTLSGGYFKVPGSREFSESFRTTLGADRTMATTFFRPNFSPGVWASGEPIDNLHYIAMVANSFNGLNLADNRIGSHMGFGGSLWWEPFGKFGAGPSDVEWHERPSARIGSSLTVSRESLAVTAVQTNPEDTVFRLSNGTPLALLGSLAPGVQVNTTSVQLLAIDAAAKYRGFSLSGEYYLRWLDDFSYTGGPLAVRSLFTHGAYAQTSYFVIPKRLEGYGRYSFVTGGQGGGDEWSGGLNWYVLGTRSWRMTFDVTRINHSPADNDLTGYRAGESGTLFQLQMLTDF